METVFEKYINVEEIISFECRFGPKIYGRKFAKFTFYYGEKCRNNKGFPKFVLITLALIDGNRIFEVLHLDTLQAVFEHVIQESKNICKNYDEVRIPEFKYLYFSLAGRDPELKNIVKNFGK